MKILFSSSEVFPFAKTGGLADVSYALPKALSNLGHDIKVVMPRYYQIDRNNLEHIPMVLEVSMGSLGILRAGVFKSYLPKSSVEIYFIDYEDFFGRDGIYNDKNGFGYPDNDMRFIFFSKAALILAKNLGFSPDIVHANDWQTASQMALIKKYPEFNNTKGVLTIHNLEHQGIFDKRAMDYLEIGWEHFNPYEFEALGGVNLLKGGIYFADKITTVSPTYAKEIQTPEFGFGLDGHIRAHSYKLRGILNGVDYDEWNPKTDKYIAKNYDIDDMSGKRVCKEDLANIFNVDKNKPIIGLVSRFAKQKGIELIASSIYELLHLNANFIFLGSGEKWAEGFFSDLAGKYPNFRVWVGYSNELAHKIEAGSDYFLMPSLFEPCGLNQIYSLRYGTLPIVRAVGGLDDTIENFNPYTKEGTGFKFWDATKDALVNTVKWALSTYNTQDYEILQKRAMQKRFSWEKSAKEYEEVYKKALNGY